MKEIKTERRMKGEGLVKRKFVISLWTFLKVTKNFFNICPFIIYLKH